MTPSELVLVLQVQVQSNAKAGSIELPPSTINDLLEATEELKLAMGPNCDLWQGGANSRIS